MNPPQRFIQTTTCNQNQGSHFLFTSIDDEKLIDTFKNLCTYICALFILIFFSKYNVAFAQVCIQTQFFIATQVTTTGTIQTFYFIRKKVGKRVQNTLL